MYAQVEKPKENNSRANANAVAQKKNDGKQGFGFVDNRPEAITQRKLQSVISGLTPIQLQTKVVHQEQTLTGDDYLGVSHSQLAGKKMTADLDPMYPIKGSKPGGSKSFSMYGMLNRDWSDTWIKGHLLNDNLGGLGILENLFPITASANKEHLNRVEQHVKNAVLTLDEWQNESPTTRQGSYVRYTVEATPDEQTNFMANPDSKLNCNATSYFHDTTKNYIGNSPVVNDIKIISSAGSSEAEGHNEALKMKDWGSVGSGKRGEGDRDKGKMEYVKDSSYWHIEFNNEVKNEYEKWSYNGFNWIKKASEQQTPISIEAE